MTGHDSYGNSAHELYAKGLCPLTKTMPIAPMTYGRTEHKGQAALWVTNGCTSMSKPISTWSTPIADNELKKKNICSHFVPVF